MYRCTLAVLNCIFDCKLTVLITLQLVLGYCLHQFFNYFLNKYTDLSKTIEINIWQKFLLFSFTRSLFISEKKTFRGLIMGNVDISYPFGHSRDSLQDFSTYSFGYFSCHLQNSRRLLICGCVLKPMLKQQRVFQTIFLWINVVWAQRYL